MENRFQLSVQYQLASAPLCEYPISHLRSPFVPLHAHVAVAYGRPAR